MKIANNGEGYEITQPKQWVQNNSTLIKISLSFNLEYHFKELMVYQFLIFLNLI